MADVSRSDEVNPLKRRLLSRRAALSLAALAVVVALLVTQVDIGWGDTWGAIRTLNPWWYAAALVTNYATFLFKGARWRVLIANAQRDGGASVPSLRYASWIVLISWFINSVTWFRMGDAYRAYAYASDSKTSFSRSAGIVLADRAVEVVTVAFLVGVGVAALIIEGGIDPPLPLAAAAVGVLALMAGGLLAMAAARRWVMRHLPPRLQGIYNRIYSGTMGSFGRSPLVFALALGAWACEVGRLFFVVLALGTPIAVGLVILAPMAHGLLAAAPLTPGGIGVAEAGLTGLLQLDLAVEAALAVALVDRSISYLSTIVVGGGAFAARQFAQARRARRGETSNVDLGRLGAQ